MRPFAGLIQTSALKHGLDPVRYAQLIWFESVKEAVRRGVDPRGIRSYANAVGLAQIHLPSHPDVTEAQAKDPKFALNWGARFFADKLRRYDGNYDLAYRKGYNPGYTGSGPFTDYKGSSPKRSGTILFPVAGGAKYTNDWGNARATTGTHKGTDLFAPEGTPVVAVTDGKITKMGNSRIGGLRIWLDGKFYYAHLSGFAKGLKAGQTVKAGQVLGYVGTTGDAKGTPPHLHFGYDPSGTQGANWANPYPVLKGTATVTATAPSDPGGHFTIVPATPAAPETLQLPQLGAPADSIGTQEIGVEIPGSAQHPYEPIDPVETWQLLASDPFSSPETQRFARRASLLREDEVA